MISIIIPTCNEAVIIQRCLAHLAKVDGKKEVIVVDGGSSDGTRSIVRRHKSAVLVSSSPGRALQQNAGAKKAKGDILLFLHADTKLPRHALTYILSMEKRYGWGAFFVQYAASSLLLKLISWKANHIRLSLFHLPFGDQAIFVKKSMFRRLGGFPPIPIMEDMGLSKKLRKEGKPGIITHHVITSSRRFSGRIFSTYLKMGLIRLLYACAIPPALLHKIYYKKSCSAKERIY